jgi:uncharacterized protein (TIGR00369 family)
MTLHVNPPAPPLPVLAFLQRHVAHATVDGNNTSMRYPTAISRTLGMRIVAVAEGEATVEIDADPALHGNQQGTIHGGLISELADAAIGTAHSTFMLAGESFASIDLKVSFMRPVWASTLRATARPVHRGKTVSHYSCDILRADGKRVATAVSAVMTLRGDRAAGR